MTSVTSSQPPYRELKHGVEHIHLLGVEQGIPFVILSDFLDMEKGVPLYWYCKVKGNWYGNLVYVKPQDKMDEIVEVMRQNAVSSIKNLL